MTTSLAARAMHWYRDNARRLPWRDHPDPYAIWVSEVMLQQTRVDTVIPYFERWMERFPTLETLANASLQQVLGMWEGLGYYSRARNLHQAAQIVIEEYSGELPRDIDLLRGLPGIGRYTAGAIASIAFEMDEPTLDGNIRRVLARVFDLRQPARSKEGGKILWELAGANLPPGQAGEYNQALMELGATICTPRAPLCTQCPLADSCLAYSLGVQAERPVKTPKPGIPHHTVTAAIIRRNGQVLIAQRPLQGLLGGMWEFPGGKVEPGEDLAACIQREIREELGVGISVGQEMGIYQHAYTHFRVTLHAFLCGMNGGEPHNLYHTALAWSDPVALTDYPMGKIDRQIANDLSNSPTIKSEFS
jgi:A/G-specific adenine glycosylase